MSPEPTAVNSPVSAQKSPPVKCIFGTMTFGCSKVSQEVDDTIAYEMIEYLSGIKARQIERQIENGAGADGSEIELDTAIIYADGETEKILGRVLKKLEANRELEANGNSEANGKSEANDDTRNDTTTTTTTNTATTTNTTTNSNGDKENHNDSLNEQQNKVPPFKIAIKANPWHGMDHDKITGSSGGGGGLRPHVIREQVELSLQSLQMDSAQILYLHAPDASTDLESSLRECNELHKEGKFSELGLSNYSSWEVALAVSICEKHNWVRPTVYQGMYNAITRDVEKELFACLRALKIRFYAYNPLAGGLLTGRYDFSKFEEVPAGRFKNSDMYLQRYWKEDYFKALETV
jgi:aryl-alcohol dehydrogenase-like predicted oxidoreductase